MVERPPIRRIKSRVQYASAWMQLRVDDVELQSGGCSEYGVVERKPFVLVIPKRGEEILLVRQFRYPIERWTWEFPQGARDDAEDGRTAALRELAEETGCEVQSIVRLGRLYEAAGFATQFFDVFVCEVGAQGETNLDVEEDGLSSRWFCVSELRKAILQGEFDDAPSLAAMSLVAQASSHFDLSASIETLLEGTPHESN